MEKIFDLLRKWFLENNSDSPKLQSDIYAEMRRLELGNFPLPLPNIDLCSLKNSFSQVLQEIFPQSEFKHFRTSPIEIKSSCSLYLQESTNTYSVHKPTKIISSLNPLHLKDENKNFRHTFSHKMHIVLPYSEKNFRSKTIFFRIYENFEQNKLFYIFNIQVGATYVVPRQTDLKAFGYFPLKDPSFEENATYVFRRIIDFIEHSFGRNSEFSDISHKDLLSFVEDLKTSKLSCSFFS